MNEPIKVGDIVWAVRDCCGHWLGRPFTVRHFGSEPHGYCDKCGQQVPQGSLVAFSEEGRMPYFLPVPWLQKLNDPGIETSERTGEEVGA